MVLPGATSPSNKHASPNLTAQFEIRVPSPYCISHWSNPLTRQNRKIQKSTSYYVSVGSNLDPLVWLDLCAGTIHYPYLLAHWLAYGHCVPVARVNRTNVLANHSTVKSSSNPIPEPGLIRQQVITKKIWHCCSEATPTWAFMPVGILEPSSWERETRP